MRDYQEDARITNELTREDNGPDPFSSAVRATRMPMLITDPSKPDNPIVFVNGAFSKLTGFDHDEILGRNCRFLQGPLTDRGEVDRLREAIVARVPIELELLNYRKDGTTFWNRLLVSPVFNDDGEQTHSLFTSPVARCGRYAAGAASRHAGTAGKTCHCQREPAQRRDPYLRRSRAADELPAAPGPRQPASRDHSPAGRGTVRQAGRMGYGTQQRRAHLLAAGRTRDRDRRRPGPRAACFAG
ncbi:MAG: PAS domain-containing protein [Comamonadaceae bacterium]|nr:MAG: PAS domain-containing protein [Comamonadaceae bacterium]